MAGYSEMPKLIAMHSRPTAIFTAYDAIAFGAIDAILEHGIKVPDIFSIIGMNNLNTFQYKSIELTSICEYNDAVFDTAFDILCKRMNHSSIPRQSVTFYAELIKRKSVKNLNL